jgi:hypothetical protein
MDMEPTCELIQKFKKTCASPPSFFFVTVFYHMSRENLVTTKSLKSQSFFDRDYSNKF